jgi:hypothetical protein
MTGRETQFNLTYASRVGTGLISALVQQNAQMNACPGLPR